MPVMTIKHQTCLHLPHLLPPLQLMQILFNSWMAGAVESRTYSTTPSATHSTGDETKPPIGSAPSRAARAKSTSMGALQSPGVLTTTISLLPPRKMKRKAEQTSSSPKRIMTELVGGLSFEARSKLLVQEAALQRSIQRARQESRVHPPAPDDLRTLALPPAYVRTNSDEEVGEL